MLEKRWNGGTVFRPVKAFHAVPSHSNVSDAAQTTTSLLRSVSNAAFGVRHPAGVPSGLSSCHSPFWYCQKSLNVVNSSFPPYIQIVLFTGSVVNEKRDRGPGRVEWARVRQVCDVEIHVSATGCPTTGDPPNIVNSWR